MEREERARFAATVTLGFPSRPIDCGHHRLTAAGERSGTDAGWPTKPRPMPVSETSEEQNAGHKRWAGKE
jgi:hypothetical protein